MLPHWVLVLSQIGLTRKSSSGGCPGKHLNLTPETNQLPPLPPQPSTSPPQHERLSGFSKLPADVRACHPDCRAKPSEPRRARMLGMFHISMGYVSLVLLGNSPKTLLVKQMPLNKTRIGLDQHFDCSVQCGPINRSTTNTTPFEGITLFSS